MQAERFFVRDRTYGLWHRVKSIARYLAPTHASALTMLDVDSVMFAEYRWTDRMPLCLVEVARDVGQSEKDAKVLQRLAEMADLPAYVALYRPSDRRNPSDPAWPDIDSFRVRRLWPKPEPGWRELTPRQWANALLQIRQWQLRRFEVKQAANDDAF
ncbi:MAG TPA: hypothetical protein PKA20_05745 [Burkholderiaceae bacterium]|nr:hypothetical protein [Burkholderiaceae bacterium]